MTETIPTYAELAARFVYKKIAELRDYRNDADVRATLAKLRHGIGNVPGANPDIWAETFAELPEELLSKSNTPTAGELAIHTALTLFALHQQGSDIKWIANIRINAHWDEQYAIWPTKKAKAAATPSNVVLILR